MKNINECIPIVSVSSIEAAKVWFGDLLGFKVDFDAGEVVGLLHGNIVIYCITDTSENNRQPAGSANLNFMVDEVDDLYDKCVAVGIEVLVEPGDRPYGQRDFAIRDHDGNVYVFSCGLGT